MPISGGRTNPLGPIDRRVALAASLVAVAALWLMSRAHYSALAPAAFTLDDAVRRIGTLLVAALFIERAVEVILTPWRAKTSALLELARDQADAASRAAHERALAEYRATSQRLAFWLASGMGTLVAVGGLRGLAWLVGEPTASPVAGLPAQRTFFRLIDVLLTGMVIGGGADGVHKIVLFVTDILEPTRSPAAQSPHSGSAAPASPPQRGTPPLQGHVYDPGA